VTARNRSCTRNDERPLRAVDRVGRAEGRARSELVREALEVWLRQRALADKVARHRDGYARHPVRPGEFLLGAQVGPK
jgi:hypothetical protein